MSAIQLTMSPARKTVEFRVVRSQFHRLMARAWAMEVVAIDAELERIRAEAPLSLRALEMPAYNLVASSLGVSELYELTWLERLALGIA